MQYTLARAPRFVMTKGSNVAVIQLMQAIRLGMYIQQREKEASSLVQNIHHTKSRIATTEQKLATIKRILAEIAEKQKKLQKRS